MSHAGGCITIHSMEAFLKALESTRGQKAALEAVEKSRRLREAIAPITAVACGVVPLGPVPAADDTAAPLIMAVTQRAHPDVAVALQDGLRRRIEVVRCDSALVRRTIEKVYVRRRGLNLQTFQSPDFLGEPGTGKKLLCEKVEKLPPVNCAPAADRIVLLDVSLHSILINIDRQEPSDLGVGPSELGFKIVGGRPVLFQDEPPADDEILIVQRACLYDGVEHAHGIGSEAVETLPHVLHPTEIQIVGLAPDGSLTFHLYDHCVTLAPGEEGRFEVEYYYLRFGMRYHRRLILTVRGIWCVPRDGLVLGRFADHADADDIGRLFGLEFGE